MARTAIAARTAPRAQCGADPDRGALVAILRVADRTSVAEAAKKSQVSAVRQEFRAGFRYAKAGAVRSDLRRADQAQGELDPFAATEPETAARAGDDSVVLCRKHSAWPSVRPLDPADFPGEVRLVDASGHVLESKSVASMNKFRGVTWRDRRVAIKGVADRSLPD